MFQVDIVIDEVHVDDELGGISGNLLYDPTIIQVFDDEYPMFAATGPGNFFFSDPTPDTDGDFVISAAKLGGGYPVGEGVVARVTLRCLTLGITQLTLTDLIEGDGAFSVFNWRGDALPVQNYGSTATVNCGSVSPGVTPTPGPTPNIPPNAQPGIVGLVAIDTDIAGNGATIIGPVDTSITADLNDFPVVDIVVDSIDPSDGLGGIEGDLIYDPGIVRIVGLDGNFMVVASGYGSASILSDSLPDADGDFALGIVNGSDPHPESGVGVLGRLTLDCVGVGTTILHLAYTLAGEPKPRILRVNGSLIPITTVQDATITCVAPVGGDVTLAVSTDTGSRLAFGWLVASGLLLASGVATLAGWRLSRRRISS